MSKITTNNLEKDINFISYLVNFLTNYNSKRSLLLQSKFTY